MYYTNGSTTAKTFHGVTFGPGETKEVFGIINDPKFILSSKRQEPPKRDRRDDSISVDISETRKKSRRGRKSAVSSTSILISEDVAASDTEPSENVADMNTVEVDNTKEV